MHQDAKIRRAIFIEVREKLHFADPAEVLRAISVYCCDGYGAMLWQLEADPAQQYFRAWNTAVKLTHGVPRSTFTYLVEGFLAGQETSLRNQVLGRYPGFLQSLLQSPSLEVQLLSRVAAADPSFTTRQNIEYVRDISGVDPKQYGAACVAASLPTSQVPEEQQWRLGLLTSLLALRQEKYFSQEDSSRVEAMLASLCST